jgi:hypothetical protein
VVQIGKSSPIHGDDLLRRLAVQRTNQESGRPQST